MVRVYLLGCIVRVVMENFFHLKLSHGSYVKFYFKRRNQYKIQCQIQYKRGASGLPMYGHGQTLCCPSKTIVRAMV